MGNSASLNSGGWMDAGVTLIFDFVEKRGSTRRAVSIRKAVIGGWTGRDKAALQHHIDELAKIGVKPPATTPLFYRVGVSRIVQAEAIEVIGEESSGEVEYVMVNVDGRLWIGAGSDHTDRAVERIGVTVAKQLCDKSVAGTLWPLDEIDSHWDELALRSHIMENGEMRPYQEGLVGSLLSPRELLSLYRDERNDLEEGALMFGGTCAAIGGVRSASRFSFELVDPVLGRAIRHAYDIRTVPIVG
jgi:Protein of unknown function (DUF2848)